MKRSLSWTNVQKNWHEIRLTLSPFSGMLTKSIFSSGTGMACDTQNAMVISAIESFIFNDYLLLNAAKKKKKKCQTEVDEIKWERISTLFAFDNLQIFPLCLNILHNFSRNQKLSRHFDPSSTTEVREDKQTRQRWSSWDCQQYSDEVLHAKSIFNSESREKLLKKIFHSINNVKINILLHFSTSLPIR